MYFSKKKKQQWQAISGGVEDDEILIEIVKRKMLEKIGIKVNNIYQLSTISSIPVININ